ncbi:hypothetical protein C0991_011073 [Blastosporella zonata]|nr:hypothetical protein C0991_011073 [Blastosporella zonata]
MLSTSYLLQVIRTFLSHDMSTLPQFRARGNMICRIVKLLDAMKDEESTRELVLTPTPIIVDRSSGIGEVFWARNSQWEAHRPAREEPTTLELMNAFWSHLKAQVGAPMLLRAANEFNPNLFLLSTMSAGQSFAAEQLLELLLQLKSQKTTPEAARSILNGQPQIAYALMTLMVKMNAVNFEVFQKTLADYGSTSKAPAAAAPTPTPVSSSYTSASATPVPALPPHMHPQAQHYRTATPPSQAYPYSNGRTPPPPQQQQHGQAPFQPAPVHAGYGYNQSQPTYGYPGYSATPPAPVAQPMPAGIQSSLSGFPEDQRALLMRVITMTPEELNALPPPERQTYIQLRNTLGVPT